MLCVIVLNVVTLNVIAPFIQVSLIFKSKNWEYLKVPNYKVRFLLRSTIVNKNINPIFSFLAMNNFCFVNLNKIKNLNWVISNLNLNSKLQIFNIVILTLFLTSCTNIEQ